MLFKTTRSLSLILPLIVLILCGCKQTGSKKESVVVNTDTHSQADTFPPGTVFSKTNANGVSYSLYLPSNFSTNKKYSFIIFLDPHGKGSFPLKKYSGLADKFGVCLLGSNDSKNGMAIEQGVNIVQALVNECQSFPFSDGDISLCGFSGGAKLALVAGNSIPRINCIIYCGAAFPPQSLKLNTALEGFAGKKDMNYTEVKIFSRWAASQVKVNGIAEWSGKHEWPDSASFQRAFYWHGLNSSIEKDDPLISEYLSFNKNMLDHEKNPLRRVEILSNKASLLQKYLSVTEFKKEIGKILLTPEYTVAKEKEATLINNEEARKQELMNSFMTMDLNWWSSQIKILAYDSSNESNQRLLGYISLACWSYSSKAVEQNDIPLAMKALEIYKMADPENSEHEFLKACLYAKNNNADSAVYFLKEAVKLGMDDRSKIENEKNLVTLRGRTDYEEVVTSMKFDN